MGRSRKPLSPHRRPEVRILPLPPVYINSFNNMNKLFYYLPRCLAILFVIFVSIFALDVFGTGESLWREIGGFLIHLIPSYILIIATIIAWKKEFTGGVIFIILGVLAAFWIKNSSFSLLIILPPFIIGILFLIG